ncbi:hypothetical protein HYO65_gp184 [Tenacibaculum phage PTm1]|uniref:Uncharacterized protein n=2 Tax=Shirahamavirus PTm1 TaxID=2846435 RepID=A0A5S9ERP1_9CAUD|nr:hypothetical protein HYO65_gp184 [Tenacibaculum phage PTm1]BBI90576.1 hypothetical protein [Tenacibaculum phage PTm1]BBI90884.1 hypothetical protein [Tenacibaculum phage PTm5]
MKGYSETQLNRYLKDSPILNYDATTPVDILQYYITNVRAINAVQQSNSFVLANHDFVLDSVEFFDTHAIAKISNGSMTYTSIYIKADHRGKGVYTDVVKSLSWEDSKILTTKSCKLDVDRLESKLGVSFVIANSALDDISDSPYIKIIMEAYGDKRTKRTNVPYMNHIFEGMQVINHFKNKYTFYELKTALFAYILHPIFQAFDNNHKQVVDKYINFLKSDVIFNSVSYGHEANSYLRYHYQDGKDLTFNKYENPIVGLALIADKIQNFKDLELWYGNSTHEHYDDLEAYFNVWLQNLGISEYDYKKLRNNLIKPTSYIITNLFD